VVCLDSGCGNYDQLWSTTSLRGMLSLTLRVDVLREGVHSGDASGIVPSSFRLIRQLLSRVEDEGTGEILLDSLHASIPKERRQQARIAAEQLTDMVFRKFPFHGNTQPQKQGLERQDKQPEHQFRERAEAEPANNAPSQEVGGVSCRHDAGKQIGALAELVLARTWRPTLSVTGADGLPALADAGNVLRPSTALKLSFRLPPTLDGGHALETITHALTRDPPANCSVEITDTEAATGWNAPALAAWLAKSVDQASHDYFDRPAVHMGEGGSIPFMAMLGEKFPQAQFLITGVLGPGSNAHGPNEFLHLPTGKRLTCAVAQVLVDHSSRGC
jgi:acetylornithine deacetylase/succinyl-diaminopimelate desuccinylase-like protein